MIDFKNCDLIITDIETTGLNPIKHEIIEIGAVRIKSDSLIEIADFSVKIKPTNLDVADPESLDLIDFVNIDWTNSKNLLVAIKDFNKFAENGLLAGWNFSFDWSFLSRYFYSNNVAELFDYHRIDLMSIAYDFSKRIKSIETGGISLRKFAKFFEIDFPETHSALADAKLTAEVYRRIRKYEL